MPPQLSRSLFTLCALSVCLPLRAIGQQASQRRDSLCAAYVLTASASPDSGVRIRALKECGSGGINTIAQLVRAANTHRDPAYLRDLGFLAQVKAAPIEAAAASLVQDRTAAIDARFVGLNILVQQAFGRMTEITIPDGTPPERVTAKTDCLLAGSGLAQSGSATASLRQLTEGIIQDQTQPEALRSLSLCVRRGLQPKYVPRIDASRIRITGACAGGVRLRSDLDEGVTLSWRARTGSRHGLVRVREHTQIIFSPLVNGTVLFYNADGSQFVSQVVVSKKDKCR
jgi:hypothetical protein